MNRLKFLSFFKILMILELNVICLRNDRFETHLSDSSCWDQRFFFAKVPKKKSKWLNLGTGTIVKKFCNIFFCEKKTFKKKLLTVFIFFHAGQVSRVVHKKHSNNNKNK